MNYNFFIIFLKGDYKMIEEYIIDIKRQLTDRKINKVAEKIGVTPQTLYNFMKGRTDITLSKVIAIDQYLKGEK